MKHFLLAASCALGWLNLQSSAAACSTYVPPEFEIRSDPDDVTPPAAPRVDVERVKRGKEPERHGCTMSGTSCDGSAWVVLHVDGAEETEETDQIGYVLEVKGKSPDLSSFLQRPVSPTFEPGMLQLSWEDGEGHAHYDFDIYVWSVDRAGNMSEAPTKVHVESAGTNGCAAASTSAHGSWLAALLLLLARRRACAP